MQAGFVGSLNLNIKSGAGGKFERQIWSKFEAPGPVNGELKFKRFKTQI